jgi:hypothetical protein
VLIRLLWQRSDDCCGGFCTRYLRDGSGYLLHVTKCFALCYWITCCCPSRLVDVVGVSHAGAGGRCTIVDEGTCAEATGLIHGVHSGHGGTPVDGTTVDQG